MPSNDPSSNPSESPSNNPSDIPSNDSSSDPSTNPSEDPSENPSTDPSEDPSENPSTNPTDDRSRNPSEDPSKSPTFSPAKRLTPGPTQEPTPAPTPPPTNTNCLDAVLLATGKLLSQPIIDGKINQTGDGWDDSTMDWNGTEYTAPYNFSVIPMYVSGLQSGSIRNISGYAHIGYDCNNTRFCVAAYLTNDTINENCNVNESIDDSFVEVGNITPPTKLKKNTNGANFSFVKYPGDGNSFNQTIGK